MGKPTMGDVAVAAGVSISTVSHVLNGTRRVSPENRSAVEKAAAELGFRHHPTVRSAASRAAPVVGIVGPLSGGPASAEQLIQISLAARDAGMIPLLSDSVDDAELELGSLRALSARGVDAVVIAPSREWRRAGLPFLRNRSIPFVVVDRFEPGVEAFQLTVDTGGAIGALTTHLLEHGRRELVLIHSEQARAGGSHQSLGFLRAHREHGLAVQRAQMIIGADSAISTHHTVETLLSRGAPIDGLILGSATMVGGAERALSAAGLNLGAEIALGVIEDHPDPLGTPSDYLRAASPQELLARQCIATIQDLLEARAGTPRHLHLPTHLMPGPSCTCPRHAPELTIPPRLAESLDERLNPSGHGRRHPTSPRELTRPETAQAAGRHHPHSHHSSPRSEMTTESLPDQFFPSLHVRPLQGWVNDPNGIHRIGDTWHLFYQHNPTSPWHDRISWGHATSKDLLRWQDQGIALRPRQGAPDAAGCWSGVGLVHDGVSSLVYSAVTELDGPSTTVIAPQRADRAGWSPNIIAASSADATGLRAMRDPFIVTIGDRRFALHGAGDHDQRPSVIVHDCTDWENWIYLGPLLTGDDTIAAIHAPASIWECPQLVRLDGRWVLIVSLWVEAENLLDHLTGVAYLTGDIEMRGNRPVFTPTDGGTFDDGPDFYAPQAVVDEERVLIWGWSWEGAGRTDEAIERSGYNGSLTFPRTLRDVNGAVIMEPAGELTQLRDEELDPVDLPSERHAEIWARGQGELRLRDAETGEVHLSLSVSTEARIFLDGSLTEVFVAGQQSHTERLYGRRGVSIDHDESLEIRVWQLRVRDENGDPSPRALI